MHLEFFWRF